MKFGKVVFITGLVGILIVSLICFYGSAPLSGEVESVEFFENSIVINLLGQEDKLVIFGGGILDIKRGEKVLFWGKEEIYKGEKQIIVERLEKIIE